jgi:23S rRNA (guanosine2251-2'-O)-methyltransferase
VRRVSAGAAEVVPVARVTNLGRAVDQAREAGFWIVGLDEGADSELWDSGALDPPVGLVLGSEGKGISRVVLQRCDTVVRIPSQGRLASLNVAVAGALAMFEATRRRGSSDTL